MIKRITNWGNFPSIQTDERAFSSERELREVARSVEGWVARGNGRCYGDASLAPKTISTLKFDKILSFDTEQGIFECQSGVTLDQILEVVVPKGWFLPVTPGTKFITMGGAVASDVHGKNHHVDGSFSQHVVELEILLAEGELVRCSRTLYVDLFEATCGGMGLTGVIVACKFRLKKIASSYIRQRQIRARNLDELIHLFEQFAGYTYSVAWVDCLQKGQHFGRSILMLGEHAKPEELPPKWQRDPLKLPRYKRINLPVSMPGWVLSSWSVKIFNWAYYHKNLRSQTVSTISYEPFFYPLDAVLHWNRLYGTKGFVQYQFVLPLEAKAGLVEVMGQIGRRNMGSFLTVLKVFGKQESCISFPMEGYTLALDFPIRAGLFEFLDELDETVLNFGGRLYLSKDARMKPATFQAGYPELERFLSIVKKYNPNQRIRSLQSERLHLTML